MTSSNRRAWRRLRRRPDFVFAFAFIIIVVFVALFASLLAPYDPLKQDLRAVLAPISSDHWLGTDQYGRDVLSRLVFGARVAVLASVQAVAISVVIGVPAGLLVGFKGGRLDRVVMRVVEAVVSLPSIVMAITVLAVLGTGLTNAMIAIGIIYGMSFLRLACGLALAVREELYIDAARVFGLPTRKILFLHVLPNVAPPLIVQTTLVFGAALLAEAALSFLGLGVQPPNASWGGMLSDATAYLSQRSFLAVPPGAAIAATVLAFNVLGDAARDSLGRGTDGASLARADVSVALEGHGAASHAVDVPLGDATASVVREPGTSEHVEHRGAVLEIEDLRIAFRSPEGVSTEVVTGIDLVVGDGESVGLVGESGCGKTVTAMSVLGLLPVNADVSARTFMLDGTSVIGASKQQWRSLRGGTASMIFQDPMNSLDPVFTVGDQLVEAIRLHRSLSMGQARREAIELLDRVHIPDAARRMRAFPHQLSGGMAQRVMIAMALSTQPRLLIADEPTTALDVTVQGQVIDLLRELQENSDMSVLFITHDLGVVADICDRVVVMYAGEIVEENSTTELYRSPLHPYSGRLLESRPENSADDGPLVTIPGVVPLPGTWGAGCRFADRCNLRREGCDDPQRLSRVGDDSQVRCHVAERLVHQEVQ